MTDVQECFQVTKELLELVKNPIKESERDEKIKQIESLLERRELLLSNIHPPFTEKEKQMGTQMVEWSRLINGLLKKLQLQIKKDIQGLKLKRTTVQKYANPYETYQPDGFFYDKKN